MCKEFTVQSGMFIAGGRSRGGSRVRHFRLVIWNTLTSAYSAYSVSTDSVLRLSVLKEVRVLEHTNGLYSFYW